MNCASVKNSYYNPNFRIAVKNHIASCEECYIKYSSYFDNLHNNMIDAIDIFVNASERFDIFVQDISLKYYQMNKTDVPHALAQIICRQVHDEFVQYFKAFPDDTLVALCWLQKTFVLCRFFSSEQLIDKNIPFSSTKPFVESMVVPLQPSMTSINKTFGKVTSLLHQPESTELFGTPIFNPELQAKIVAEISSGKYIHALTLICDSPKHGVLSSLINLSVTAHPEWVYRLGFLASSQAINEFLRNTTANL